MRLKAFVRVGAIGLALVFGLATHATAQTPDGSTPAEEQACAGLDGALFGLCNAYCEAKDCEEVAAPGCEQIRRNFERQSDGLPLICDPCIRTCAWNDVACVDDATAGYDECIASGEIPEVCKRRLQLELQRCKLIEQKCLVECKLGRK